MCAVCLYKTRSGNDFLPKMIPKNDQKCDDSPLPCTQYLDKSLRLINPKRIESGFLIIK